VPPRQVDVRRRIVRPDAEELQVAEERARCGRAPGDRRRREPSRAQIGEIALDVGGRGTCDRRAEERAEATKVAAVRVDRARRAPGRQQRQESLHLGIGGLLRHDLG
jgi:hypothetical protein